MRAGAGGDSSILGSAGIRDIAQGDGEGFVNFNDAVAGDCHRNRVALARGSGEADWACGDQSVIVGFGCTQRMAEGHIEATLYRSINRHCELNCLVYVRLSDRRGADGECRTIVVRDGAQTLVVGDLAVAHQVAQINREGLVDLDDAIVIDGDRDSLGQCAVGSPTDRARGGQEVKPDADGGCARIGGKADR